MTAFAATSCFMDTSPSPRSINQHDMASLVRSDAEALGWAGFHLTIAYKQLGSMDTPHRANHALKKSIPLILTEIISSNWQRHQRFFKLHIFLDKPGSRHGPIAQKVSVRDVADGLHHHAILLAAPNMANRIANRVFPGRDSSETRIRSKPSSSFKTCYIQKIVHEDLKYTCSYAAKSYSSFGRSNPDEAYVMFPA